MKKITATILASLFVAPVTMADVTVYGSLRTAIEYSTTSGAVDNTKNISRTRLVDESSRLGFRGSDKLDNGLTVLWQSEHRPRVGASAEDGSGPSVFGDRNTFLAVKGDFGMVMAGRYDDLIDQSMGDFYRGIDVMDEISDGAVLYTRRGATKVGNLIEYYSPDFNGFKVKAQYDAGSKSLTYDAKGYGTSVFYNGSLFDIGVAYKKVSDVNGAKASDNVPITTYMNGDYYKTLIVGGNLKPIEGLNVSLSWNRVKRKSGASNYVAQQDGLATGMTYVVGKTTYSLSYGHLNDGIYNGADVDDSKVNGYMAGLRYQLSKVTSLCAGVNLIKSGRQAGSNATTKVTTGTGVVANAGGRFFATGLGLRTDF